ncbi:MAG: tetratricopeptide repeat protein [Verrucomicrobia bacterium]|nr:tetratricopeptide repeat protein [Verrucomicrobiota bacterium]
MAFYRRWLLIFCALVLGGQVALAASREDRAYAAAAAVFQTEMWSRAENAFAQFVQKYPQSTNAPMAVLLQAQAQFNQGKYADAVTLLANRRAQADSLADQYVLWTGEAQFAAGKFVAAADTFTSLADNFPDSPARLQATVEAAAAYGQLQQWSQLSALLEATNGVFERKADQDAGNELVSRGRLLLAQARFAQKDYAGASALLQMLNPQTLKPELDWQRAYLLCHTKLAAGELDAALAAALNLKQIAQLEKDDQHRAEGVVLQADILEKLGRAGDAMTAYQENFTPGTPDDKQRESILKYAELAAGQKQFSVAGQALDNFLKQFPDSPQADSAMLASGELLLKDYDLQGTTNNLPAAKAKFDQLLAKHPGSALAGKALLDRGWCQWLAGKVPESLADFDAATRKKLSPEDLAVAKFKAGDVLFAQKDFKGALEHYRAVYPGAVLDSAGGQPSAERELGGRAMYQSLRACLELGDAAGAADAFAKIFQIFSGEELGQDSALLYGESLVKPGDARALFEKLAPNFSGSPLEPQLKLAIARTYEQEQDWPAAITNYEGWIRDCPTNSLRPQVDYALALANFHAGNEAGALALFSRFVAQNPANALAPQAQWWVAEHFFRTGEYIGAETNYEAVFQNTNAAWKSSSLVYPAQLMAGRSAMGRAGYKDAVSYFTQLFSDTNCPDDYLKVKARFACGAARMQMDSSDTNASFINLQTATNLFSQVVQLNPTNELGARAWGEIGDCAQQLGDYVSATNAYTQVFGANSMADISARSRAEVGYGLVLEKMADQTSGIDKTNLLNLALDDYLDVFYASNRRDGEVPDAFWVKKAGLQAAPLVRSLFDLRRQKIFYLSLQTNLPPLAEAIQKKIDALPPE